ncbi:hypothetical protein NDU88_006651 [Pleurodeles waltl]|uniref:Uncharacterized protein n=1 Tax=Pleurodeles waltl TaxID=8319 RepID=A0AAV7MMY5_PLEWA|nr:hypothetical protein NDU88_006651 [Pleurodeles waltl]
MCASGRRERRVRLPLPPRLLRNVVRAPISLPSSRTAGYKVRYVRLRAPGKRVQIPLPPSLLGNVERAPVDLPSSPRCGMQSSLCAPPGARRRVCGFPCCLVCWGM